MVPEAHVRCSCLLSVLVHVHVHGLIVVYVYVYVYRSLCTCTDTPLSNHELSTLLNLCTGVIRLGLGG